VSRLRVAGVGAGYFSQFHLQGWRAIPDAELVGWSDKNPSRVKGLPAYPSLEELLEKTKPDLLDIVTPPETHLELVRAAAARGVPVICQKPLAPTYAEAVEVVQTAERAGVPLIVHENFRWQPWYRA
jgi:D-apiose dehydrogenase